MPIHKITIPGYAEALEKERGFREEIFISEHDSIAGIKVNHVTPFLLARLFRMKSYFFGDEQYSDGHVIKFLWAVSPEFCTDSDKRNAFVFETAKRLADFGGFDRAADAIEEYLTATFLDSPEGGKLSVPYVCSIAWMITKMALPPFGWSEERTLHTPLRKIYQFIKCVKYSNGEILRNAISDKVKEEWLNQRYMERQNGGNN